MQAEQGDGGKGMIGWGQEEPEKKIDINKLGCCVDVLIVASMI